MHDLQRRRQPFLELAPVDQARQRIVAREVRELAVQLPLLAHVVKHHDRTDHVAAAILDRRRRILNGHDLAVTPRQDDVVRERHDAAFLQAAQDRILDELAGRLVRELDDVLDRFALRFAALPARELLGHRVQVIDQAVRIRGDDRIADRLQRHLRPLFLVEQRALGGLALRDVRDRSFVVQRAAVRVEHHARVLDRDDRATVALHELILEIADSTVARELADQPFALLRFGEEIRHVAHGQLARVVVAEHPHERGIHGQELALRRRLEDAVDHVVEQCAEPRFAVASAVSSCLRRIAMPASCVSRVTRSSSSVFGLRAASKYRASVP